MGKKIYALLVGIDDYPPPSRRLRGCVNDLRTMEAFLRERIAAERLRLCTLIDRAATRERIIDTFRIHLGRAGAGDTALFYYAGHGSQEPTPPLYAELEPDRLSETLVAWDSRQSGGWDLADKELAVLVAEVAARDPHVLVILDSCHSGTATRLGEEGPERRTSGRKEPRPAETYWFFRRPENLPPSLDKAGGWRVLPAGRHVLLAACRDYEVAREAVMGDGRRHGLFSYYLVQRLERLGPEVTYRELHKQLQVRVNNHNPNQLPQAEGDLDGRLFDGAILPRPKTYHLRWVRDLGWRLDAGAVHGIQHGSELAVLPAGGSDPRELSSRLATVRVSRADAGESAVELLDGHLPCGQEALPAVLTRLPLAPLRVAVEGDAEQSKPLRRAIRSSPFLVLATQAEAADLVVRSEPGSCRLRRTGVAGELTAPLHGDGTEVAQALEHIARWQTIAMLENPGSPLAAAIEMQLHAWLGPPSAGGEPAIEPLPDTGEIRVPHRRIGRRHRPGRFTVRLRNRSDQHLYFVLAGLDESFAVKILHGAEGRLAPGHTVWIRKMDGIPASVPDELHRRGVTRRRDVLLLLVSEVQADFSLLEQERLGLPYVRRSPARSGRNRLGVLEALLERVAFRELDEEPVVLVEHQWAARRQVVVAERPLPVYELDGTSRSHSLVGGIRLHTPVAFAGSVRLHNAPTAIRRLGGRLIPPFLRDEEIAPRPFALAGQLGSDPGLSVIEFRNVPSSLVTPEAPLRLESRADLAGEVLLVVAYDGHRHFLAGGPDIVVSGENRTGFSIRSLPEPAGSENSHVWLFFYSLPREEYADLCRLLPALKA